MEIVKSVNSVYLEANKRQVWSLLTDTKWVKQYMYNCDVFSDYKKGSVIEWKGEYEGQKAYLHGLILDVDPLNRLKYSGIDPSFGDENNPKDYFHVTYDLKERDGGVLLTVINETFDGNEERMKHIVAGWENLVFPKLVTFSQAAKLKASEVQ